MAESKKRMNPWLLHLQKLALELKCPLCLELLNKPVLLPCDHIFCNCCAQGSAHFRSECPVCKQQYGDEDIRAAPYIENVVTIYKSLDVTSANTIIHPVSYDNGKRLEARVVSLKQNSNNGAKKEHSGIAADGNSSNGNCLLSLSANSSGHDSPSGSVERQIVSEVKMVTSSIKRCVQEETLEMRGSGEERLTHFQSTGQVVNVVQTNIGIEELDLNQMEQVSPGCANLLGDVDDNSDLGSSRDAKRQKKSDLSDGSRGLCKGSRGVCAFCHSSDITDDTGPMLHYANGKLVVGDVKPFSESVHVHQTCIDWTPQVYYDGDNIRNLESELARAGKLKCSECGLKGAGLGCYMKSCRKSYHAPCAAKTPDCKWDFDDFIMLCPTHRTIKFPREKIKSRKTVTLEPHVSTQILSISNFWSTSHTGPKEWVFCGSALSSEEKYNLIKFASSCGATVLKTWNPNVTHVIAATDANGAYTRTLKVLMGILNGKWIVTVDWIKACLEANKPVDEEAYEVSLDNHGFRGGAKTGRLQVLDNAPKLFNSLNFYFSGDFLPAFKNDLLNLVRTGGGNIIENKEKLLAQSHALQLTSTTLVVYNEDPLQEYTCSDKETVVFRRLRAAEDLARGTSFMVIKHTWILESIAACMLQPYEGFK